MSQAKEQPVSPETNEDTILDGIARFIDNNQVQAFDFEGGVLLSDERREKILARAKEIEEQNKPFNRIRARVKYQIDSIRFDIKRLADKLPKRKRTFPLSKEDLLASLDTLIADMPILDITPLSTAREYRDMTEHVTMNLCLLDKAKSPSDVVVDTAKETATAHNLFHQTDLANRDGRTYWEEDGEMKSKPAPPENKGNAMLVSFQVPDSMLSKQTAKEILDDVRGNLKQLLTQEGVVIKVTTRGYECEIARENGVFTVKQRNPDTVINQPVTDPVKQTELIKESLRLVGL